MRRPSPHCLPAKVLTRLQARIETKTTGRSIRERANTRRQPGATQPRKKPCSAK